MSWARLPKRVFDIDIEHCPHCGGAQKIIAVIEEPTMIVRILAHLGLPARAAALLDAGAGAVPSGLMRRATMVLQGEPTIPLGPRSRERGELPLDLKILSAVYVGNRKPGYA